MKKVPIITVDGKSTIDAWKKADAKKYNISDFKNLIYIYKSLPYTIKSLPYMIQHQTSFEFGGPYRPEQYDEVYYVHAPYEEGFYLVHKKRKDQWFVENKEYLGNGNIIRIPNPTSLIYFIELLEGRSRNHVDTHTFHQELQKIATGKKK